MKAALRLLLAPYRFSVDRLFRMGEVGWAHWFDSPSLYGGSHPYLYQDSAGTTPVTAVGDTIGLSLDRAYGGRTDGSLIASGATGLTGTATAASYDTSTGAGSVSRAGDASNQSWVTWTGLTTSAIHRIRVTNTGATSLDVRNGSVSGTIVASIAAGATSYVHPLTSGGSTSITITATNNSTTATFTVVEFGRVPGTHLIQATGTARPTLSARVNAALATEAFSNAAWGKFASGTASTPTATDNFAAAPDGTMTAARIVANRGAGNTVSDFSLVQQSITWPSSAGVLKVWIKSNTGASQTIYARTVGENTVVATTSWQLFTINGTASAGPYITFGVRGASGSDSSCDILVWHPDLRTADDAAKAIPAYQRVGATAADHDTAGFPHYALFDGSDDSWASTATVDGSGSDKLTVVTGVTKNSDAAGGVIVELTADSNSNNGAFFISGPNAAAAANFGFKTRGTVAANASGYNAATYTAPTTRILSLVADLASSVKTGTVKPYIDGVLDQGEDDAATVNFGGNFANATLYFGSRASTTARFNGREYASIGRFGPMSETERNRLESWVKNLMRMP